MATSRKIKVLLLSFGNFLSKLSSLILSIALTRIFIISDYANFRQTIFIYTLVSPLLLLGFDKSIYFFFADKNVDRRNDIYNLQLFLFFISALYILFFYIGGANFISISFNNPGIKELLLLYSIMAILEIPVKIISPILVIEEKVKLLTLYNISYRILFVLTSIIIAYFYRDVKIVLFSQLIIAFVGFLISQKIIYSILPFVNKLYFSISIVKKYLWIGIPLSIATIIGLLGKNIDKVIISYYLTPIDFAIYANGAIEIPLIGSVTGAIMAIILVDFSKFYKLGETQKAIELWNKATKITSSILIPLMFLLILNADFLINLMYGAEYKDSVKPFVVYLFLLPIRSMIFSSLITATGKTKVITYGAIIFIISNIILSIVFIILFGVIGPAIATVIATYGLGIYYTYKIKKEYKVNFFKVYNINQQKIYFVIGGLALVFSFIVGYITNIDNISLVIIKNVIFVLVFVISTIVLKEHKTYIELLHILSKKK